MMKEFEIKSQTIVILGMTTYLLGLACGPLVLAPLSELYGRRPIYLTSLGMFISQKLVGVQWFCSFS